MPLANPLNAWLAADPEDSEAEGRVKSALESIGLDLANHRGVNPCPEAPEAGRPGGREQSGG